MSAHQRPQVGNGGRVSGGSSAPGCRPGLVCTSGQPAVEAEVHGRRLRLERVEWPLPLRCAAGGVPVRRLGLREAAATAPRSHVALHATGEGSHTDVQARGISRRSSTRQDGISPWSSTCRAGQRRRRQRLWR